MLLTIIVLLPIIFVAHYIADFIVQTSWQATNKSSNIGALSSHIFTYTLTLGFITALGLLAFGLPLQLAFSYAMLNGVLHFATDFVTSRLSKKAHESGNQKQFWMIIGMDQLIHQLCLLVTAVLLFA